MSTNSFSRIAPQSTAGRSNRFYRRMRQRQTENLKAIQLITRRRRVGTEGGERLRLMAAKSRCRA